MTNESQALKAWVTGLESYAQGPPKLADSTLRIEVRGSTSAVEVGAAVEGYELVLDVPPMDTFRLACAGHPPSAVSVKAPGELTRLSFDPSDGVVLPFVHVVVERRQVPLILAGPLPCVLSVASGPFRNKETEGRPDHLVLQDAEAHVNWSVLTLTLRGSSTASGAIHAAKTYSDEGPSVGGGEWRLGDLLARHGAAPHLVVASGAVHVQWAARGTQLHNEDGSLHLGNAERRALEQVELSGPSRVYAQGWLDGPSFGQAGKPVNVSVSGRVLDATGHARLYSEPSSVVSGHADTPLALSAVDAAAEAEVENVDIYGLGISDLTKLGAAERFYPWLPGPGECRRREDRMFSDDDERLARRRRMHFWASATAIVKNSHAPGRIQSEVRFAAQRARRRALPAGKERLWLSMYGLVGYGERVIRPLVGFVLLSFAVAVWFAWSDITAQAFGMGSWRSLWPVWWDLARSPLAFFRLVSAPERESVGQSAALLLFRVLGLFLLLLPLLAVRRLVRLE